MNFRMRKTEHMGLQKFWVCETHFLHLFETYAFNFSDYSQGQYHPASEYAAHQSNAGNPGAPSYPPNYDPNQSPFDQDNLPQR